MSKINCDEFDPETFWEARLSQHFDEAGVGMLAMGKAYNRWVAKAKIRAYSRAVRNLGIILAGKSVLDIGSGTGVFVDFFLQEGASSLVGIDISQTSVNNLTDRFPHAKFIQADITRRLELGQRFDIINISDVSCHIVEKQCFETMLKNIAQVSKRGSLVFFTDVFGHRDIILNAYCRFRDRETWSHALEGNGMRMRGIFPMYILLNAPLDVRSPRWSAVAWSYWNTVRQRVMACSTCGSFIGFVLYHLDRSLLTCGVMPSTKLLICEI